MVSDRHEVWITGVGLVSALGEGLDQHWDKLMAGGPPPYDDKTFAPYITFPVQPINFDAQIPKKGDQRQMEAWQRIGRRILCFCLDEYVYGDRSANIFDLR